MPNPAGAANAIAWKSTSKPMFMSSSKINAYGLLERVLTAARSACKWLMVTMSSRRVFLGRPHSVFTMIL